ncbi:MAG: DNA cytosine methyltransferase [Nitrospirae bacterium]|nr:DNA cytosine methyltransferase [Nitrospirota bacterium]MBI3352779.1 DNA cytosine methyltransferase [Nitrospirota bacterium]
MTQKLTVVDLFSGCGGLSLGFESAGFEIMASYDSWKPAIETYRKNFHHTAHLSELNDSSELPNATVIVGGPPCQGFSSAGRRLAEDDRNTLVCVFARLIARYKPLAFAFENVEGFLTQAHGRFVFDLLEPLIDAGYRIHLRKVNAAHYGVPQHRKRVLAIGGLGWDPTFPEHTHSALGMPGAKLANGHHLPFTPTLGEAFEGLSSTKIGRNGEQDPFDHIYLQFNEADSQRAYLLKPGQRMRDLPEELWHESYRKRAYRRVMDGTPTERRGGAPAGLRRLSPDEPSKTITGGALRDFVHPTEDRPLSLRECARLQTFPDDFVFVGTQNEKIQMIGNAVPIRLAQHIAITLKKDFKSAKPTQNGGALLSFVPTLSEGMSPVLQTVCDEIKERFLSPHHSEQISLCL